MSKSDTLNAVLTPKLKFRESLTGRILIIAVAAYIIWNVLFMAAFIIAAHADGETITYTGYMNRYSLSDAQALGFIGACVGFYAFWHYESELYAKFGQRLIKEKPKKPEPKEILLKAAEI